MLPDRVSNPGPLTYESGALPIALRGPASTLAMECQSKVSLFLDSLKFYFFKAVLYFPLTENYQ